MSVETGRSPEQWTTRKLLAWMGGAFTKKGLDSPRLLAELLMAHIIGCDRLRLYMESDRPATPLERDTLRELVARALKGEPVQYLVGEGWFFGLPFRVSPSVLIPRPSSEALVEAVLGYTRAEPGFGGKTGEGLRIADVCTGSGCIAIALLKNLPGALGVASDISPEAIELARQNAARHGVDSRLEPLVGDLLSPMREHPGGAGRDLHVITANPPYIPDSEWNDPAMVDAGVRDFEPELALRGGADGLRFVGPIIRDAPELLRPGGLLAVEIAAATAMPVLELARAHPLLSGARIVQDSDALPRVLVAVAARPGGGRTPSSM